jgi:tRNA A-37 threonylcarbamoyl transferase component Bud32
MFDSRCVASPLQSSWQVSLLFHVYYLLTQYKISDSRYPVSEHLMAMYLCSGEGSSSNSLVRMATGDSRIYVPDKYLEVIRREAEFGEQLPNFAENKVKLTKNQVLRAQRSARVVVEIKPDFHHPLRPTRDNVDLPNWMAETGDLLSYMHSTYFDPKSNPVAQAVTYACLTRTRAFIIFTLNRVTFGWVDFDEDKLRVKLSPTLDCTRPSIRLSEDLVLSPWEIFVRFLLACESTWYIQTIPDFLTEMHVQALDRRKESKNAKKSRNNASVEPKSDDKAAPSASTMKSARKQQVLNEVVYTELWDSHFEAERIGFGRTGEVFRHTVHGFDAVFKLVFPHVRRPDREPTNKIAQELKNEAQVYQKLHHLQGRVIPRLLWYGKVVSGLGTVLITEFAGQPLPETPTPVQRDLAVKALQDLHANGVLHGDVAVRNFVWRQDDGVVFILDFGFSQVKRKGTNKSDWARKAEAEMDACRKLFL